jgi:hypothetical protein
MSQVWQFQHYQSWEELSESKTENAMQRMFLHVPGWHHRQGEKPTGTKTREEW